MMIGIFLFVIGAIFGSFLNVVIYRVPREISLFFPRSTCPHCGRFIFVFDNIPIVSYLYLSGKCRFCGWKIPFRYLFVELASGAIPVIFYLTYGFSGEFWLYSILMMILLVASFVDLEFMKIPNPVVIFGALTFLMIIALFDPKRLIDSLISGFIAGLLMLVLSFVGKAVFRKDAVGFGDVKLTAMTGLCLGLSRLFLDLFLSFFLSATVGIVFIFLKKVRIEERLPFAPFLAGGTFVTLVWGEQILSFYLKWAGLQ
ncbi:MAG: prepilin peptidase [archaeon]